MRLPDSMQEEGRRDDANGWAKCIPNNRHFYISQECWQSLFLPCSCRHQMKPSLTSVVVVVVVAVVVVVVFAKMRPGYKKG